MINFFRKIRKKMLDNNKPMKYIRYAIGEILLVVIGILIALSINNWNQNRITKLKEKKALIQLVQNLNSNLKQFSYNIKIENDIIKSVEILIDHVGNKKPYVSYLAIHAEKII